MPPYPRTGLPAEPSGRVDRGCGTPYHHRSVIFFGDIHNHNAHGYGQGSIERSVDIARTHLDFFGFTGHAAWPDMAPMEGGREAHRGRSSP